MKNLFLLFLLILPCNVFALSFNDSLIGTTSTKIQILFGPPIEKVEYKLLNKSSFVYPEHVLYFKDDVLVKIQSRNENSQVKKVITVQPQEQIMDSNPNLINEMFSQSE